MITPALELTSTFDNTGHSGRHSLHSHLREYGSEMAVVSGICVFRFSEVVSDRPKGWWIDRQGHFLVVWLTESSHLAFGLLPELQTPYLRPSFRASSTHDNLPPFVYPPPLPTHHLKSPNRRVNETFRGYRMSFYSGSSTYPEPPTSPSPSRTSPTPVGFMHGPLKRTYAFYIPRKSVRPTAIITSHTRRSSARRSKGTQPAKTYLIIKKKELEEKGEEPQHEPEETMAPPAKRRKIKN
ncbi:hypothetical protein FRC02_011339 [Tulasnella sp. 418]|nr:hypothetical protein FRC02_011339 [Tulasnella sp. 418]